ncbi:minor tail protein [Gordonia phage Dmitri]|nr:minor tail protein [Gordonia phage Dmitri]
MSKEVEFALLGTDRSRWDIAGPLGGRQGAIIAAEQVEGIYDAPIKQEWSETVDGVGGTHEHTTFGVREFALGFHLFEDEYPGPAGRLESNFRMAFSMERDKWDSTFQHTRLVAKTPFLSGVRMLTCQMYDAPEIDLGDDRIDEEYFNVKYLLRGANPMWMGKRKVTEFWTTGSSATGTISVSNPTDRPMMLTWILEGAGAEFVIPDPSWAGRPGERAPGGAHADRVIELPEILSSDGGGVTITRERNQLHAKTKSGANYVSRMMGNWVRHEIPPYTPLTELPISVSGAVDGAMAQLVQPRAWSRPWGLEMVGLES